MSSNGKNAVAGSIYLIIFNKKLKLINKFIKNLIIRFLNVEFSDDAVQCCFFFLDFPHPLISSLLLPTSSVVQNPIVYVYRYINKYIHSYNILF